MNLLGGPLSSLPVVSLSPISVVCSTVVCSIMPQSQVWQTLVFGYGLEKASRVGGGKEKKEEMILAHHLQSRGHMCPLLKLEKRQRRMRPCQQVTCPVTPHQHQQRLCPLPLTSGRPAHGH
ncbi:hypothetical protein AOLI_G00172420 [Acnodon oligacanthus]